MVRKIFMAALFFSIIHLGVTDAVFGFDQDKERQNETIKASNFRILFAGIFLQCGNCGKYPHRK